MLDMEHCCTIRTIRKWSIFSKKNIHLEMDQRYLIFSFYLLMKSALKILYLESSHATNEKIKYFKSYIVFEFY